MRRNDGRTQVAPLREQRVQRCAVVLQVAALVAHREAHRAVVRRHAELAEQLHEVRVRAMVEDDEAGVDVLHLAVELDAVRVRVAADVAGGLVHRDVVRAVQAVRDHVAGDAGADRWRSSCARLRARRVAHRGRHRLKDAEDRIDRLNQCAEVLHHHQREQGA